MDIENTIHIILQTEEEQILNLPLDELSISKSVYRSLLRSGMETIGDIANCWDNIRKVRSIGEKAYGEISGALNLWYLKTVHSLKNF
jgi:hypothetical protein